MKRKIKAMKNYKEKREEEQGKRGLETRTKKKDWKSKDREKKTRREEEKNKDAKKKEG